MSPDDSPLISYGNHVAAIEPGRSRAWAAGRRPSKRDRSGGGRTAAIQARQVGPGRPGHMPQVIEGVIKGDIEAMLPVGLS
jgi:hypothetical protein